MKEIVIDPNDGCIICVANRQFHKIKGKNNQERDEWMAEISKAWKIAVFFYICLSLYIFGYIFFINY